MKNKKIVLLLLSFVFATHLFGRVLHVSKEGSDTNNGTQQEPFLSISKAAFEAIAGDTILIQEGTYREWVSPANAGISPLRRIVYMAAEGEEVWLKGSEVVEHWEKSVDGLWITEIDNQLFGDFNPFAINVYGDWLSQGKHLHLGEVYIDGESLSEGKNYDEVKTSTNTWIAEVGDQKTVLKVNFGKQKPNKSLVEVNVRPVCFFPKTTGVNYIKVRGLRMAQAATQWSPPTGEQVGIIGPNWSKGWVIEDCEVMQSKCVGICLGKTRASGHNMWSLYNRKYGYNKSGFNREIEAIFKAYDLGWNKTNVGSHLIQNNKIHQCGQAGIVGHMGAAFSIIRHNEIRDINRNTPMSGAETAGIKLHAAIDARLEHNVIVNTTMGIWLDWQAQGTHVLNNVIAESEKQDMFFEVSHGPTLVYNNICLSELSVLFRGGQGMAVFNNLFWGGLKSGSSKERYTPYHYPHSTKIKGLFNNTGGDVRFYNNVFLSNATEKPYLNGLASFNPYPVYSDDMGDTVRATHKAVVFKFPVWTGGNLYYKGSKPYGKEIGHYEVDLEANATLEQRKDGYYLNVNAEQATLEQATTLSINTEMLGQTFISEAIFDNPDGSSFQLEQDLFGKPRNLENPLVGPFEDLGTGEYKVF